MNKPLGLLGRRFWSAPAKVVALLALAAITCALALASDKYVILRVASESMQPAFCEGDYLVVRQRSMQDPPPEWGIERRGQAIVFLRESKLTTKRLVGLPNDRIAFNNHEVFRNGSRIAGISACPVQGIDVGKPSTFMSVTIPKGFGFVLGDNIGRAEDSRLYGTIPLATIVGQVALRMPSRFSPCACGFNTFRGNP